MQSTREKRQRSVISVDSVVDFPCTGRGRELPPGPPALTPSSRRRMQLVPHLWRRAQGGAQRPGTYIKVDIRSIFKDIK
ncbi:MAG: hypothetical protein J5U17_03665 [Candidatus Methanoperedens sp.]|nr:hypothetical protein [Candidatus Methanoperedens sp.]MCE8427177.1 hypothetical protein [Candidatus Methanoperedens sp.]